MENKFCSLCENVYCFNRMIDICIGNPDPVDFKDEDISELVEIVKFYANGGNSNRDVWKDEKLGYFTGKRAREFCEKYSIKL